MGKLQAAGVVLDRMGSRTVVIGKAKRPKTTPFSRQGAAMNALADTIQSSVKISLTRGLFRFRDRVDVDAIAGAILAGEEAKILDTIPWEQMETDISGVGIAIEDGMLEGANKGRNFFPATVKPRFEFDTNNPRVAQFIKTRTASLVVEISENSRNSIRAITRQVIDSGLKPKAAARSIRNVVGLTSRQAQAVTNFRLKIEQGRLSDLTDAQRRDIAPRLGRGRSRIKLNDPKVRAQFQAALDRQDIDGMADKMSKRMIKQRSEMIARTESLNAVNAGHLSVWQQAADDGIVDRANAMKRWIIDPTTACEICMPQQGQTVPIDEQFSTPVGPVDVPTQVHPQCNCMMELLLEREQS